MVEIIGHIQYYPEIVMALKSGLARIRLVTVLTCIASQARPGYCSFGPLIMIPAGHFYGNDVTQSCQ